MVFISHDYECKTPLVILFLAIPTALFSQATCSSPAQLTICPDTTLLNQTNLLMGNDAPPVINIGGEDVVYQLNVPVATRKIYVALMHLTGGTAKISLMRDSCNGSYLYASSASAANVNYTINVSGATKYFLWIDATPTIHFDLSVGADTLVTIINHPNTQGNWGYDTSGCASPVFIAAKPFYQVTYNGVYQTNPMTLAPLSVSGTMCISTFLRNPTGDEGVRTFSFAFGTGYNTIIAPDTIQGFYNNGYWLRTSFLNTITYTFFDSLSTGRGDFDGSPNTCLRYDFCFNLIPTSNSPSITNIIVVQTSDGFGAPSYGYSASGCCSSGYPTCHFGNGGSGGGVNAIGFGMNDPGNGNPLPIELVNFDAIPEKTT
ncbi:MAG: hypothetical protein IPP51_08415 [Bacteroidetes bacterium]|nr:hypothetical protein [Bacteroidota bacterium]